ncbi:MAG: flavin reductase family protein [Anaerolineae bacterium]|nr:flavin reductase family protein [Anaerolineae bacterium]
MPRTEVPYTHRLDATLDALAHGGILLASTRGSGESNLMTIGWATVGVVWGLPVMVVLVRPSRHTFQFVEDSGLFSVNVPSPTMREYVAMCGTKSGRDVDKLAGVPTSMGQRAHVVTLDQCPLVYECRVVHTNDVAPEQLAPEVLRRAYPQGDYHRLYYGEILGTFSL